MPATLSISPVAQNTFDPYFFGALGNNVQDDTLYIQSARNAAAAAAPFGVLQFSPGNFKYTSATPLQINGNMAVFAQGGVAEISGTNTTTDCFVFNNTSSDFPLSCQSEIPNVSGFVNGCGIAFRGALGVNVQGSAVTGCMFAVSFETSAAGGYNYTLSNSVNLPAGVTLCTHSAIQFKITSSSPTEECGGNSVTIGTFESTPNFIYWNAPNGLSPDWGPGPIVCNNFVGYAGSAVVTVGGTPANLATITCTINGTATTYTLNGGDTIATACQALVNAINANASVNTLVIARHVSGSSSQFYVGSIQPLSSYTLAASSTMAMTCVASQGTTSPAGRVSWSPSTTPATPVFTCPNGYFSPPSCMLIDHAANFGTLADGNVVQMPLFNNFTGNSANDIFNMMRVAGSAVKYQGGQAQTSQNNSGNYVANTATNTRATFAVGQPALIAQNCPVQFPAAGALAANTIKDYYFYHPLLSGESNFLALIPQFSQPIVVLAVEDETVYAGVDGFGPVVGQIHVRLLFVTAVTYVAQNAVLRVAL